MSHGAPEFGYFSWIFGQNANPEQIRTVATTAERLGYDGVSIPDHITLPAEFERDYPVSSDGTPPWDSSDRALELFQVGAFLAAHTSELTLTSNVIVVPWRHPALLAKSVCTLDFIADGRFEFGGGAGWSKAEADILDVPFEERGSRFDEFLDLFERVLEEGEVSFEGPHHSFQKTGFHPVPADDIPIWIGGWAGPTFRRIGQYGDGWSSVASSPAEIAEGRERIMAAWEDFDRRGTPEILLMHPIHVGDHPAVDASERRLMGEPDSIIEDVQDYLDAGVTRLDMIFFHPDPSQAEDYQLEQLELFADEVCPSFG